MTGHPIRDSLTLVAAAALLLSSCADDTPPTTLDTSPSTPSSSATEDTTPDGQAWEPLAEQPEEIGLPAGAYGLTANGVSDRVVVVQAPEGYAHYGGWTFAAGEPFRAMGFVTADLVPPDPCGAAGHDKFAEEVDPGPSVADLAEAVVAQKGAETSTPVPVTVDGHAGLYLTYRIARGIDVPGCQAHTFDIFSTGPGAWYLEHSRDRAAIWILDVEGERLVLAWVAEPGVPRAKTREMTRMVRSAGFVES